MDFFARQESARRHTKLLEVYFALAIIGTILLTYFAIAFFIKVKGGNPFNPHLFFVVVLATLAVIVLGGLYKTAQLASGGQAVAEMLGGRAINPNTTDADERKFLNVVEEMSIASGTPVPQLYMLPSEHGINAFAAGHSTRDMVICATRGALKLLTRDELQGVIGHEFSHILNGDMKLNLRLMGLVFGLLCLAICGRILLETRNVKRNPLPLLGLLLIAAGSIGVFFGKLIKSAVSRQREFLADASAVQFTRNPLGLATALKKVGHAGSRIEDPNAEDASHFFFANGLGNSFANMFATHPPLEERIRLLDPAWDGKFIAVDLPEEKAEEPVNWKSPVNYYQQTGRVPGNRVIRPAQIAPIIDVATAAMPINSAIRIPHSALSYAADWRSKLSPVLANAAREPMSAVALVYALLLSHDADLRATQLQQLQARSSPGICEETAKLFPSVAELESTARLPLASLTMTALRRLSPAQFAEFERNIQYIIASDQQLELFEYTLQKIVLRQLEPNFRPPKRPIVQFYVLKPLVPDCTVLLSALAYAGQSEPAQIESAFRQGAMKLNLPDLPLSPSSDYNLQKIELALDRLNQTVPHLKSMVLNACAETVAADGVIQEGEAELLRAIADTLDCPIPPFLHLGES